MLDVYRNYYGLTGEPFRLGPDHRFSLHHESYASAKAYLEYAIYQGEGFIAITGEPGTGKTTLINEILAGLDRDKVEVATLTSTQLESRDLLYMVASSFDLHPDDTSKANLLVELESFLVCRIRAGQRAILVVDEAQGLSTGALEELRLLANLQYKYQLLLQIFLVGQEQLRELIRAPGMEHLHQRLVAATSLEPLSYDETVDYVEHRLSKVAWQGDPAIDEGALRELYRYSGGVPRRINLIANRLFLYGGMEEKHRFDTDDSLEVIQGLIDEFLLAPEPLIDQINIAAASDSGDAGRSRGLPRHDQATAEESPPVSDGERKTEAPPDPAEKGQNAAAQEPVAVPARKKIDEMERPVPPSPTLDSSRVAAKKKAGGKGIVFAVVLLTGAGAAYLMREPVDDQSSLNKPVNKIVEAGSQVRPAPEQKVEPGMEQSVAGLPAEGNTAGVIVRSIGESGLDDQLVPQVAGPGKVLREQSPEPVDTVDENVEHRPTKTPPATETPATETPATETPATETPATETPATEAPPATVEKNGDEVAPPVLVEPTRSVEHPATADVAIVRPDASSIEARRLRLKQAAEQRFLALQAQEQAEAELVTMKPEKQSDTVPVRETTQTTTPGKPAPVKKKPRFTADDVVSALLDGRWSSRGKPASLLPSETTFCNKQTGKINCLSVPQNIKTRYGLALYKVETTLSEFSPQGHFEMSYRTLVKLVGAGVKQGNSKPLVSDDGGWQITAYSMSCKLTGPGRVSCVDGKGISREYQQAGLGKDQ